MSMDCVTARQWLQAFGQLDAPVPVTAVPDTSVPNTPVPDRSTQQDERGLQEAPGQRNVPGGECDPPDAAVEHVRQCPDCRAVFQRQTDEDASIRTALNSVKLPATLLPTLLANAVANVAAQRSPGEPVRLSGPAATTPRCRGRSTLLRNGAIASCLVGLAVLAAVLWPAYPSVDIETASAALVEVLQHKALAATGVEAHGVQPSDGFAASDQSGLFAAVISPPPGAAAAFPVPQTMMLSGRVLERRRQWLVAEGQFADVYFFGVRNSKTSIQRGALLVLPRRWTSQPSTCGMFLCAPVTYQLPYCITRWCEGEMQYVCVLEGSSDGLLELRNSPDAG